MTKDTFLGFNREEGEKWDSLLGGLDRDRMLAPGVCGDWSIKDVIAHLTAWEQRAVACLQAAKSG